MWEPLQTDAEKSRAHQEKRGKTIDVDNVAMLANLSIPEGKKAEMESDMMSIVEFANQLSSVDTTDIPITAHVIPMLNVLRPDVPGDIYDRGELLANAPTANEEYIYVPKVIE